MQRAIFVALSVILLAAAGRETLLLREQAWTAPNAGFAHALTHEPTECLAAPRDAQQRQSVEIGRALFRSPALLGGPAARAGLSCHACHANGRVNAHFLLPELTDRAGASDVTSEWASRTRGDGVLNPIPIPDLVDVGARATFGRGHALSLHGFVGGVVIDEFQGEIPPAQAFDGLMAYLRALQSQACPEPRERAITLTSLADDVRRALAAARGADAPTARLVLLAAQDGLGRIAERLPAGAFGAERGELAGLSRELGRLRDAHDIGAALDASHTGWLARFDALTTRVGAREAETYFDAATLEAVLSR